MKEKAAAAIPRAVATVLRLLRNEHARERARDDLSDLYARVRSRSGSGKAYRVCMREAVAIVAWSVVDALRRSREGEPALPWPLQQRRQSMFGDIGQDLRMGVRSLARRPGFTFIAAGVLALGIGANAAIFTLAERLFLEPPPGVRDPDRLVRVFSTSGPSIGGSLSFPDYADYRAAAGSVEGLAAASSGNRTVTARIGGGSVPVRVLLVSDNWFDVLGVRPVTGRFFAADENRVPNGHPVAVVSQEFWRDRMGGSAEAIGGELVLNGHAFTVIGVSPAGFRGISPAGTTSDVHIPIMMLNAIAPQSGIASWLERHPDYRDNWLSVAGRLRGDGSVERLQAELSAVAARLHPQSDERDAEGVHVTGQYRWTPGTQRSLASLTRLLAAAVAVLLAVSAANVAILLLARASTRGREIGIRAAIGASRGRVLRQLLVESLLLGMAGAVLGLAISFGAARVAGALLPVPLDPPPLPDMRVLLFTLGISLVTSLLVGAVPAMRAARADVAGVIQGRTRHAGGARLRDGLVVAQLALSLVLVAGAALFARSLMAARSVDPGFDTGNALSIRVDLGSRDYDAERGRAFIATGLERMRALAGVTTATVTRMVPFRGAWTTDLRAWPGMSFQSGAAAIDVGMNVVAADYFQAIGVALVRGRGIEATDVSGAAPVMVVNETLAREVFGTIDVVGRMVPIRGDEAPPFEIVGVARDARYYTFDEAPRPQAYGSIDQIFQASFAFLLRTSGPPSALARPAQAVLQSMDPDLAIGAIETLEAVHDSELAGYRASANVIGVTGLMALLLATAGLYGVMAYRVNERTREIGVRMALGASRSGVAREVVGRGLRLTVLGVGLGLAGALVLGRLVQSLLYGVPARDPFSLALAPVVLLVTAVLAALVPARRAMKIDPMLAMRAD